MAAKKLTERLVDKRIIDRNIKKGLLDRADHDKHLAGLKDMESNSEIVELEMGETESETED